MPELLDKVSKSIRRMAGKKEKNVIFVCLFFPGVAEEEKRRKRLPSPLPLATVQGATDSRCMQLKQKQLSRRAKKEEREPG